jgi:hypothetical protein
MVIQSQDTKRLFSFVGTAIKKTLFDIVHQGECLDCGVRGTCQRTSVEAIWKH